MGLQCDRNELQKKGKATTKKKLSKQVFDEFVAINDKNPKIRISKNKKDWVEIGKLLNHQKENKKIEIIKINND